MKIYEDGVFAHPLKLGFTPWITNDICEFFPAVDKETRERVVILVGASDLLFFHIDQQQLKKAKKTNDAVKKYSVYVNMTDKLNVVFWE